MLMWEVGSPQKGALLECKGLVTALLLCVLMLMRIVGATFPF